jgi:hypothetical protein
MEELGDADLSIGQKCGKLSESGLDLTIWALDFPNWWVGSHWLCDPKTPSVSDQRRTQPSLCFTSSAEFSLRK